MTETELSTELKTGVLSGFYFFYGDEDYLKNHRIAEMRRLTVGSDPDLAAFNTADLFFGDGELDLSRMADALLTPPVMAEKRFLSVTFASLDSLKEKEKTALAEQLEEWESRCSAQVVLVIRASAGGFDPGTDKRPCAFLSSVGKFMKCVNFAYQTPARLVRWMERHFAEYGVTLPSPSADRILSVCGRSMYRLIGEIEKVGAYSASHGHREVTLADVDECVTRTDEDDAFRLANCLLNKDAAGALAELNRRVRKREDPILLLSQITRVFCDLSAASAFLSDGREKADFARSMKMHDYKASLYWRAARQKPPAFFAAALNACCTADRSVKLGGSYGAIEQLIGTVSD